jgi:dolichyl-phosphate-mannose-protein mannosyltransferase
MGPPPAAADTAAGDTAAGDADDGGESETVPPRRAGTSRHGTGTGPGPGPAEVPDETTVLPRIPAVAPAPAGAAAAPADAPGEDELPAADQAPLLRAAVPRTNDSELPTAVRGRQDRADAKAEDTGPAEPRDNKEAADVGPGDIEPEGAESGAGLPDETAVFLRVPPAGASLPKVPKISPADRPPDITRPQLILDDTMVDMAAVRPGQKPGGSGSTGSRAAAASPAASSDATPAGEGAAGGEDTAGNAPAGKPAKRSRSVFGPEPAARPDMLTNAETVVMASLKDPKGSMPGKAPKGRDAAANARNAAAVKEQAITEMVPVATSAAFAEAATQVMPTVKPSELRPGPGRGLLRKPRVKRDRAPSAPPRRYTPGRRTTMISRLVLLAILLLQAVLSLRLHNTAFEDESLYLYAGHMELQHLLHGAALQGQYASYFSGAPVLYPVAAGFLDQVGGLALARALSLVEMLATTVLLYAMTRRLFNERIGLCAAGFFAVTEATVFLGNFATYDATCLFLLALAAWIAVRAAPSRWPWFVLAALPAALAVAVKYAGLLFVPTIAVLPALAGWPERGRRVVWYPAAFGTAVAGLLYGALRLGGKAYMTAISSTTTNRAQGTIPDTTILREAAEWGGVLFFAAVVGTVAYVWRVRTEPEEKIAPAGGRFRRAALGSVLTGTALLAPAYQAHLHTDISFLKHIGFGLFFAAPMAGFGLARIMGDYFRRPQFGIAVWSLALVLGMVQSSYLFHQWPSSGPFVTAFAKYCKPNARYLVEVPEVPIYYLMGAKDAQPRQFTSTFFINYFNKKGQLLTGPEGFTAAVQDGYFQVIAYSNTVTLAADGSLAKALKASHSYYLAQQVNLSDVFGPVRYDIWVKGHQPAAAAAGTGKKARKPKKS